jgi:uncharacterized protein with von Willebrand factor type A (vWA) domain
VLIFILQKMAGSSASSETKMAELQRKQATAHISFLSRWKELLLRALDTDDEEEDEEEDEEAEILTAEKALEMNLEPQRA